MPVTCAKLGLHDACFKSVSARRHHPLTRRQAEQMLASTLAGKRLNGLRGKPAADRAAVIDTMLRLSRLASDFPEISELEINPLYALPQGQGAFAVDVRGTRVKT